jgi:hypothetical protein
MRSACRASTSRARSQAGSGKFGQVATRRRASRSPSGAEEAALPAARASQAEEELHGRRLAGAVGAEEAEDLAGPDRHRQVGEGLDAPVALAEAGDVDDVRDVHRLGALELVKEPPAVVRIVPR